MMNDFLKLFGGMTVAQVVIIISGVVFLFGVFKVVSKYVTNRIKKSNEKAAEWKKIAEQVQQYPEWHSQSIQIRDGLSNAIHELGNKIDETNNALNEMQLMNKRNYATTCRYRIIRFNDELFENGRLHTKEHFDQILEDIDEYEDYCKKDPDYQNSKAVMAIEHIRQVYQKCTEKNTFL